MYRWGNYDVCICVSERHIVTMHVTMPVNDAYNVYTSVSDQ